MPERRLRVLQVISHLALGGAEKVAFSVIRALRHEVEFAVFTVYARIGDEVGAEMAMELAQLGVPWFRGTNVPMKIGGPLLGGRALARAVRAFRPDIVHCHAEPGEACVAVWALFAARGGAPTVVRTIHNSVFWRFWPRIGRWCDRQLEHAYIAGVSHAAVAEFTRYRMDSRAVMPPIPPRVIYNGVAIPLAQPRDALRAPGVCRILFAGRLEPEKGPDVLCEAAPLVTLPSGLRVDLVVLGRGDLSYVVKSFARRPPAGWSVELRPPSPHLPELMDDFDLIVAPSRFEGLGLVVIEATQRGLPVVATTAQGLIEALPPEHPWLAAPGDAQDFARQLSAALAHSAYWRTAVARAQAFAQKRFAPEIMAQGYRELYATAASQR